jgi:RsiW-degrading membrane proteinase PrsW (M82 family)
MLIILASAVFPVVVFLVVIYRNDTEREPPGLLIKCFVLGCIATVPVIILEMILSVFNTFDSAFMRSFYDAFIVAALVEEGIKLLFLYRIIWKRREFDQYYDGIVYAVFVSLGFAMVENIFYVVEGGLGVALMRSILSIPGHGLFGVMMGYFFAFARFSPKKRGRFLFLSFFVPFLFHGLYDFFLMYLSETQNGLLTGSLFLGFIALMIVLWRLAIKNIRKHLSADTYYLSGR